MKLFIYAISFHGILSSRTVALSNTCASPEQKSESQPPVQEPKVNEEVEKLAKEITDLKEKNNEILVESCITPSYFNNRV